MEIDPHKILLVDTTQRAAKNHAQSFLGQKERIISDFSPSFNHKKKDRKNSNNTDSNDDSDLYIFLALRIS